MKYILYTFVKAAAFTSFHKQRMAQIRIVSASSKDGPSSCERSADVSLRISDAASSIGASRLVEVTLATVAWANAAWGSMGMGACWHVGGLLT